MARRTRCRDSMEQPCYRMRTSGNAGRFGRTRMVRKTMKMFVAVLIAAFALSSMAEAAAPKKTRHRTKHSSRVSSGAVATTGTKPAEKKKTAKKHAKANAAAKPGTKKSSTKR